MRARESEKRKGVRTSQNAFQAIFHELRNHEASARRRRRRRGQLEEGGKTYPVISLSTEV